MNYEAVRADWFHFLEYYLGMYGLATIFPLTSLSVVGLSVILSRFAPNPTNLEHTKCIMGDPYNMPGPHVHSTMILMQHQNRSRLDQCPKHIIRVAHYPFWVFHSMTNICKFCTNLKQP